MRIYDLFNSAAGWTLCRVSGALPAAFLNGCAGRGIPLLSAGPDGDYALRVRLRSRDMKRAARVAQRAQCTLEVLSAGGAPRFGKTLRRRALAAAGLLLMFGLLAWSKLYIWEIGVTGNETVPTGRILDALRECGISCGSFWPGITSDNLRSELLLELPELSWATVNIYGSRAEVVVRERVPKPEIWYAGTPIDVRAKKTGFVTKVQALNGIALVEPGSAAAAGETLISGRADSPFSGARLVHATGTVTAETYYELTAAAPLMAAEKRHTGEKTVRWALIIGKNRYNFYRNSSIYQGDCDRISDTWNCNLGGVFSLPVSLVRETAAAYTLSEAPRDRNLARWSLEEALHARLLAELGGDGVIESENYSASASGGLITVCLRARCSEDIGVEAPLE